MDRTANTTSDPEMSIEEVIDKTPPNNYVTQRSHRQAPFDHLSVIKEEMRQLMTHFAASQKEELAGLKSTLNEIRQSNQNIESSVAFLTKQNEEFKAQINQIQNHVKEDRQYIMFLENKLEDLQVDARKTNFEIKNVPKIKSESKQDLIEMVLHLSKTIDCKVTKSDIKDIYRVRGKRPEQQNTPIIIETNSVLLKTDFLKQAKSHNVKNKTKLCAKHLGHSTHEETPIFLSDNLTAKAARRHFLARDLAKSRGYKFCWTSYGKVYVRKDEGSPIILIKSEEQVHHLLQEK